MPHEEVFDRSGSVPPLMPEIDRELCRPAALTVASNAIDAADCAELLSMLGLTPQDGLATKGPTS